MISPGLGNSFMSVHVSSCVLPGCTATFLNHYDSVTLVAGDTANLLLQTVDPFDPDTHIEGGGQRIAALQARSVGLEEINAIAAQGVTVTGTDPNKLDDNHDGIGCE